MGTIKNGVAFWGLADPRLPGECWIWTGYLTPDGYGRYGPHGAHRVAYERAKGPIPAGATIDHLCRETRCINPEHLDAVTLLVNVRRGGRATATVCCNGHLRTPENTRVDTDRQGRQSRRCRRCDVANQRRYQQRKAGIR